MRIYLIGPVGVGKSYILDELRKQGYDVFQDPIIDKKLLETGTPYEIQVAIESSFLLRELNNKNGIFDTSLETAKIFTYLQWTDNMISNEEYHKLNILENIYTELLENSKNHYIFIRRSKEELKKQIRYRGRKYEIDNPFYDRLNDLLLLNFSAPDENLDIIELTGTDISPVINKIKELIKNE